MSLASHLSLDPATTAHLAIDMQRMFADPTDWHLPGLNALVPQVTAIAAALPGRNFFTRFVVPHRADHAKGRWQHYYRRWHGFTGAVMDPALIEIIDALAAHATPDTWVDKLTYSVFEASGFEERLAAVNAHTLIFTGVETDVCVLASVLTAIDRGYRVIAVTDALASSSPAGHDTTLAHVLTRLPDQVDLLDTRAVLAALAPPGR
jgi:nicotinamidase-related amidase